MLIERYVWSSVQDAINFNGFYCVASQKDIAQMALKEKRIWGEGGAQFGPKCLLLN